MIALIIFLISTYKKNTIKIIKDAGYSALLGGLVMSLSFIAFVVAMSNTTVANVVFIISTQTMGPTTLGHISVHLSTCISICMSTKQSLRPCLCACPDTYLCACHTHVYAHVYTHACASLLRVWCLLKCIQSRNCERRASYLCI